MMISPTVLLSAIAHADYISVEDFPRAWLQLDATVDVEAKAKELAVLKLKEDLGLPA